MNERLQDRKQYLFIGILLASKPSTIKTGKKCFYRRLVSAALITR